MEILRICAFGLIGAMFAIQFKSNKPEYSIFICVATGLAILYYTMTKLQYVTDVIERFDVFIISSSLKGTLIKIVLITYLAEFAANICKDAGYQGISGQIEVFGKLSILVLSIPVLLTLLETITEFLG